MKYKLSAEAKIDLRNIYFYSLHEYGEKRADSYVSSLYGIFDMIGDNHEIGIYPDFKTRKDVRKFPALKHVIYYVTGEIQPEIRRIFHSSREINEIDMGSFQ